MSSRFDVGAAVLATVLCIGTLSMAEDPRGSDLSELFRANSHVIKLTEGKLSGDGADFLVAETTDAQFVCLAEPHYVREIPRFVTGLFERLQAEHGFRYLAIEQGPFITDRIAELARTENNDRVRKLVRKQRRALHFRTVEEVEMIADVSRASEGSIRGVWGLDRVLRPSFGQDQLSTRARASDPDVEFLRDRAAWSAENLAMYRSKPGSADALSADQHREDGFKRGFRYYHDRAILEDGALPRAVFRFGHVHMGRLAWKTDASLGHYLARFAEENGLSSFHLNLQLINEPGHYWSLTDYPEYEPLSSVGDTEKWIVVDLRPAREPLRAGTLVASDKLRRLVFNFDAVLLMGGASKGRKL